MGGAEGNRLLEIPAHPHGEARQAVALGDLGQKCKMQAGLLVDWRNAHEAPNWKIERLAVGDEAVCVTRRDSGLLLFLAGIHLDEEVWAVAFLLSQPGQRLGKLGPVDGMDRLEQVHGLPRLVGLQRADEMEVDVGKVFAETGPFASGLLHLVLAKAAVALLKHVADRTYNIPVVLLYPGKVGEDGTGLSFMGKLPADRDYRPRIYC